MYRITLILVLTIGMVCVANFTSAESIKATHSFELEDAEGDVSNQSDPGKDVVKVSIKTDGKHFFIAVTLKNNIKHYLEGHKAGTVVQFHLDTDNDQDTGGKIFWTKNTGFEYLIGIRSCIKYKNGEACMGALGGPSTGFFSSYSIKKYDQGGTSANNIHDFMWKSPREDISENIVMTQIPYAEIGVVSGQTIRIVIEEKDSKKPKEAYSPDILFKLK